MQVEWRECGLHEKCGNLAIISDEQIPTDVQREIYDTLQTLEHRGNRGAGHLWVDPHTGEWLDLRTTESISHLSNELQVVGFSPAMIELYHTRYSTTGGAGVENTQPFIVENGPYMLALQHNGNIPAEHIAIVRKKLKNDHLPEDASDTRIMAEYLSQERPKSASWPETLKQCLPDFKGAYSLIMMDETGAVYAVRDPYGIRPLSFGKRVIETHQGQKTIWFVASETVTLDAVNAAYSDEPDILPGTFVVFRPGAEKPEMYSYAKKFFCGLELIYFMHEKSKYRNITVEQHRWAMGRGMAKLLHEKGIASDIDAIVPVLNSGKWSAYGLASALEKPTIEAVVRNRKTRAFTQATQEERREVVYNKHSVSPESRELLAELGLALVDDSLIRGDSFLDVLAKLLNKVESFNSYGEKYQNNDLPIGKPRSIHIVLASPPVLEICDLGIAIAHRDELITRNLVAQHAPVLEADMNNFRNLSKEKQLQLQHDLEDMIANYLGVNSVTFATHEIIYEAVGTRELCLACFGGRHPVHHEEEPLNRRDFSNEEKFLSAITAYSL